MKCGGRGTSSRGEEQRYCCAGRTGTWRTKVKNWHLASTSSHGDAILSLSRVRNVPALSASRQVLLDGVVCMLSEYWLIVVNTTTTKHRAQSCFGLHTERYSLPDALDTAPECVVALYDSRIASRRRASREDEISAA